MNNASHKGFTLVELIVVLVIIGVLAVSLVPRFFSAAGTSEYLYQDQLLNLLRRAQIQAMQCTDTDTCENIELTLLTNPDRIGASTSCQNDATHLCIASRDNVRLQTQPAGLFPLMFSHLGQPLSSAGARRCVNGEECRIEVQGEATLNVCIESEGYIRPC